MSRPSEPHAIANDPRTILRSMLEVVRRYGLDSTPEWPRSGLREHPVDTSVIDARSALARLLEDPVLANVDELDEASLERYARNVVHLAVAGRLQPYLSQANIAHPIYNFAASFEENAYGPWDQTPVGVRDRLRPAWRFMDIPIAYPIGVPASALTLNANWIAYLAGCGFNVLTYKTVRSVERDPHPEPQWVFIEDIGPWLRLEDVGTVCGDLGTWPRSLGQFSTANSFGVPSPDPSVWRRDVERCLGMLDEGQLLIVSVMGTADDTDRAAVLIDDFVNVARMAESTGAAAIELNLSCPNRIRPGRDAGVDPPLCLDPEASREIVGAVRAGLRHSETRLIAKLSCMSQSLLEDVVMCISDSVDAICGINTVQAPIVSPDAQQTPFIGTVADPTKPRTHAGVSGHAIRELGISFIAGLARIRAETDAAFEIVGTGGVATADDVARYFEAGADVVQTATGACLNPSLPQRAIMTKSAFAAAVTKIPIDTSLVPLPEEGRRSARRLRGHRALRKRTLRPLRRRVTARLDASYNASLPVEMRAILTSPPEAVINDLLEDTRLLAAVRQRILEEPVVTLDELAQSWSGGVDEEVVRAEVADPAVIRLRSGERELFPLFQFDIHGGAVHEVVRTVNSRLGSAHDPWGVADWWVTVDARVGRAPKDLLSDPALHETIVTLADAVVEPIG